MDLNEDFEVSTPCLIVQSSQQETSQRVCQSDSDPYFLKQLNISRSPEPIWSSSKVTSSRISLEDELLTKEKSNHRIGEEGVGVKQRGVMKNAGGSGDGKNQNYSEQQSNDNSSGVRRHAQTCPVQGPGGGGGGGGAGGDDNGGGNNDDSHHEPSTCEEDTSHSEPATSSSDSLPDLIKPSEAGRSINHSDNSLSTSASGAEETISQASTAIVGDAPTDFQSVNNSLVKKSSSSSSSGGYRSDLTSSSAYQGSVSSTEPSSLSSDSHGLVSSGSSHYHLPRAIRTQAELDSSTGTSASNESRDGPVHLKSRGFSQLESLEEPVNKQDLSTSDSSKEQIEQEYSSQEDLFGFNKEDSNATSSQEVSRLSTPQDRSTPVEQKLSQEKASGGVSSLYRQVLSMETSTPVESNPDDIQQSPPSQNITPNQSFQCFRFSGEEVKESSESSSSGVVKTSPETLTGIPLIIPASPTSPTRSKQPSSKSAQDISSGSGQSSLSSLEQNTTSKSANRSAKESSESSVDQLPPSPSSFRYPWRKDTLLASPEEEVNEKVQKQYNKENKSNSDNEDEEFIGLPRWQQELIQKNKKEQPVSSKSSSSNTTSSSSSSLGKEKESCSFQQDEQHSWQSEMPSEGSKTGSCLSKKHDSRSSEVKHVTFLMDVSELSESTKETKARTESTKSRKPESNDINLSLSPSSIDGQKALAKDGDKEILQTSVFSGPGLTCTQPELSEDLFRPLIFSTQESTQDKDKSLEHDANVPEAQIDEPEEPDVESQQSIAFDLHFSQSQSEMDSPPLIPEPSSPPVPSTSFTTVVSRKEDVSSSSSEPTSTSTPTTPFSAASTDVISGVVLPLSSLLKNQNSNSINTPSQSILGPVVKDTQEDYRSLQQHDVTEDHFPKASESLTIPKPLALDEMNDAPVKSLERSDSDRSVVPPLSSETSSDSVTGLGFHFSLPTSTEPLRPVTCTTPPPIRSRQQAVPITVCETPGIFSQESNVTATSTAKQQTTPSLTLSMPRQSESESEIFFQMQGPQSASSSSSTTDPLEASRTMEQSVFAQVRDKTSSSRRRENKKDDEYNPFEFTSQDDISNHQPISRRKSRKRGLELPKESSTSGSSRSSDPDVNKISRIDPSREPDVDDGIRTSDKDNKKIDSEISSAASGEDSSVQLFHRVTKTKIIKTITTKVVKEITIITTKKGQNDKVVDSISYVEEESPKVEQAEDYETDEVNFVQRDNSICEIVRPQTPPTQLVEVVRQSPRGKKRANERNEELCSGKKRLKTSDPGEKTSEVTPEADGKTNQEKPPGSQKKDTFKDVDGSNTPPLLRRESTEKIVEGKAGSSTRTPEPALNLTPGTRVFAHWSDNHFYPGVLTSGASKSGFYSVAFDDGDKRKVRAERLILRDSLHVGQHVLAQDVDGFYDPGVIVGHYRSGDENGYEIKGKKGKIKRYPSRNVILTEEQAAAILNSSSSLSRTTSGSSAGGLNTRTRSTDLSRSSSSNASTLNTRSRDTSDKDTSCSSKESTHSGGNSITSPSTSKTTEPNDETPKSSRKKNFKKFRKQSSWRGTKSVESSSEASSEERNTRTRGKRGAKRQLEKMLPTRTSPRKQKEKSKDNQDEEMSALGPLPSDDSLFAGFAFLITGCHNVKEKDPKKDSSDGESEIVEFSREHLVRQIEAGGGVVLKDFEETQISGADQCFLISSSHQRTRKFFQCLAYNIPTVHHSWVHDSSMLDQLRDYRNYLLPAGTSLETGEVMECQIQPKPKVLQGLKIYLHGDQKFKNTWSSVVLAAGCSVVTKLPNRPGRAAQLDDFDTMCDVIISGTNTLPASIRHTVEMLGIHVVALEWLFQCLINGFLVPFDGHPKYDYRNIQKDDNANL